MIYDALIVGGGPAGSTTALLLAKAGWSVALIEQKSFPRRKVCGEFISPTNLPLLKKLGIADFYLAQGGPEVKRVGVFAYDTILTSRMPQANYGLGKWGRALGREYLDNLLLKMAADTGVHCWQPWKALQLKRDTSHAICTISNKVQTETIAAKVIIMAHGSWERGITEVKEYPTKASDLLAFKARFLNALLDNDLMPLLAFPGGYGGFVHSDSGRLSLSLCIRRDVLLKVRSQYPGMQAGEAVQMHLMKTCKGARHTLSPSVRDGAWLAAGPIRPGIRRGYGKQVFYVGNIVGEAHPVVAEGISMALQSAWLLSELLISKQHDLLSGHCFDDVGLDYTRRWKKQFAGRIKNAALFAHAAMRPQVASILLPLLKCFPNIITVGARLSGKVHHIVPDYP